MRGPIRCLLSLALALLSACAAADGPTRQPLPADDLPPLAGLDKLRGSSVLQQLDIDVLTPVLDFGAAPDSGSLALTGTPDSRAWALYRVQLPPVCTPASIEITGSGPLWLLLADFGRGRWAAGAELGEDSAVASYASIPGGLSPAGYAYCAVLALPGNSGLIDSLKLSFEGPAVIHYVKPFVQGGDDSGPGTEEQPWATLQHAADMAVPDSLTVVREGDYQGFSLSVQASVDQPVIFSADSGVSISSNASGRNSGISIEAGAESPASIRIEGFSLLSLPSDGIAVTGTAAAAASDISLRRNLVSGCGGHGISVALSQDSLIEGNTCSFEGGSGIDCGHASDRVVLRGNICLNNGLRGIDCFSTATEPGDGISSELLLEANVCHDHAGQAGVRIHGLQGSVLRNNLLYRNGGGILVEADGPNPGSGNLFVNNTVVLLGGTLPCLKLDADCMGCQAYNNILLDDLAVQPAIFVGEGSLTGFVSDHNVVIDKLSLGAGNLSLAGWRGATGQDLHSLIDNIGGLFVSPIDDNWHLTAASSALSVALAGMAPDADLDGQPRPQGLGPDIGCYER